MTRDFNKTLYKFSKAFLKEVKRAKTILIFGHVNPDYDCVGSQLGLKTLIKTAFPEKTVYTCGFDLPDSKVFGAMDFVGSDLDKAPETSLYDTLGIVLDCSTASRISYERREMCSKIIKIDHHPENDDADSLFYDIGLVVPEAASCTQLITLLAIKLRWKITSEAAKSLYVGLMTDTGGFKYPSVTAHTLLAASALVASGADVSEIDTHLHKTTREKLRLQGYLYNHAKYTKQGVAYIYLTESEASRLCPDQNELVTFVNLLRNIDGYPVYFLAAEQNGAIRISLRSMSPAINEVAKQFGGGGHKLAAGCTLHNEAELDTMIDTLNTIAAEYKNSI